MSIDKSSQKAIVPFRISQSEYKKMLKKNGLELRTVIECILLLQVCPVNLVSERDTFVWKGHEKLTLKGKVEDNATTLSFPVGFQPSSVLQLHPPAAVTALALNADWNLVAAGTAHGLAVYNIATCTQVLTKCTLNPNSEYFARHS